MNRPHNSGHYTMEACDIDQFEIHLRAILGLPCPTPKMRVGVAMMVNILGKSSIMSETKEIMFKALTIPGASVHWYGKLESRVGRKMAHITVTADDLNSLIYKVEELGITKESHGLQRIGPIVSIIMVKLYITNVMIINIIIIIIIFNVIAIIIAVLLSILL